MKQSYFFALWNYCKKNLTPCPLKSVTLFACIFCLDGQFQCIYLLFIFLFCKAFFLAFDSLLVHIIIFAIFMFLFIVISIVMKRKRTKNKLLLLWGWSNESVITAGSAGAFDSEGKKLPSSRQTQSAGTCTQHLFKRCALARLFVCLHPSTLTKAQTNLFPRCQNRLFLFLQFAAAVCLPSAAGPVRGYATLWCTCVCVNMCAFLLFAFVQHSRHSTLFTVNICNIQVNWKFGEEGHMGFD